MTLPPHIRAVLARAGAEDGRRATRGDLDRDCRAAGCDCEYCVAFGRALLGRRRAAADERDVDEIEKLTDTEVATLQRRERKTDYVWRAEEKALRIIDAQAKRIAELEKESQ